MATTLGGVTLVNPDYEQEGYTRQAIDVGTMHQMADGSIAYDNVTTRYRFTLSWNAITEVQRDAIETQYLIKTSQAFSPPDSAGTYTVFVIPNSFQDSYIEDIDGTRRYYCALALEEAA
jgi:hypothetical protein